MSPAEPAVDRRIVLCSDWHLPPQQTEQTAFFERFVDAVCRDAARLFVVGDLFRAWVGPKHAVRPGHAAVLDALRRLAGSGTAVTVLRGNRDFLLDRRALDPFELELGGDAWRGELGGKTAFLSHGDELCEDDRLHKFLRAVTGHPPVSSMAKRMPLCAADGVAGFYRWLSDRRRARRKTRRLQPSDRKLRAEFERGTDLIVIGHWHEAEMRRGALGLAGKTLVRLGECTESRASYAELVGGSVELKSFPGL